QRIVVTADRELRRRSQAAGAAVTGPRWLLDLLGAPARSRRSPAPPRCADAGVTVNRPSAFVRTWSAFLPYRRHCMFTTSWRPKLTIPLGAALAATGLTLTVAAPSAGAQPTAAPAGHGKTPAAKNGDNGTVKIHRSTTSVTDPRNEPHVCVFYLDAFGFDPAQSVTWQIQSWPPTGDRSVVDQG